MYCLRASMPLKLVSWHQTIIFFAIAKLSSSSKVSQKLAIFAFYITSQSFEGYQNYTEYIDSICRTICIKMYFKSRQNSRGSVKQPPK